jgi:hypothetical protein
LLTFFSYLGGTVVRPRKTFEQLLADPRRLTYGIGALLLIGVLYTLTVAGLALAGATIVVPAWIAIPADRYYYWEIFFGAPVYFAGWILAAGIVQLLSKPFGGRGSFEQSLAVLGFALTLPGFVTWIPETVETGFLLTGAMTQPEWLELIERPGPWKVIFQIYQVVALGWYLVLFPLAVRAVQRLRWLPSVLLGHVTVLVVGFVIFIFIR